MVSTRQPSENLAREDPPSWYRRTLPRAASRRLVDVEEEAGGPNIMTVAERRERLFDFLHSIAPGRGFKCDEDALALDSLALLQVVTYLEENYGIHLAEHRIEP